MTDTEVVGLQQLYAAVVVVTYNNINIIHNVLVASTLRHIIAN